MWCYMLKHKSEAVIFVFYEVKVTVLPTETGGFEKTLFKYVISTDQSASPNAATHVL